MAAGKLVDIERSVGSDDSSSQTRSTYLPGLDGIRAIAVIAVMLYHAMPQALPGGYLGVQAFFVISGFIITRGLVSEWESGGRIDLRGFWWRRARRLLPPLFLLLLVCLTYAVLRQPEQVVGLRGDAVAALAYVTNWRYVWQGQSYFDS